MVWMGMLVLLGPACGPQTPTPSVPAAVTAPYLGTWVVALSDEEQRRLTVYQIALQDSVPGEPELRGMGLQDDDLETLRQLRALPRDAPQMIGIAEVIAQMSGILIITEDEMRMEIGLRQESVRWSLLEQQGGIMTVAFEEQGEGTIRLEDDGSLVLVNNEGQELSFVRESR